MSSKEQRAWYENALLLTVAGSIIVVMGQLAGTIIPIMYGPGDISGFLITANPVYIYINHTEQSKYDSLSFADIDIKIEDLHPYLRPYRYYIYLNMLDKPDGVEYVTFYPPQIKAGETSHLNFAVLKDKLLFGQRAMIQAIGEDGKIHNITIYVSAWK